MICVCFTLTACSESADTSVPVEKTEDASVQEEAQEKELPQVSNETADAADEKETAAEEAVDEEKEEGEAPRLILHRNSTYDWGDDNIPAIKHSISFVTLDKAQEAAYGGLASSLVEAMNEIIDKEKEVWESDMETKKEHEEFHVDESWNTFVRRADGSVTSILNEFCVEGEYDGGFFSDYIAHSYHTDTGKEIAFSEIVKDENKFYDILITKMKDYIDYAKENIYAIDADTDEQELKTEIMGLVESGECAWTLDPFGLTMWVNAYTVLPEAMSATVRFSDDTNGEVFAEEFSKGAKDEWITQIPYYVSSYYDMDDSGKEVYTAASEIIEMKEVEGGEEYYINGMLVSFDGFVETFNTINPGGTNYYDIFLLHRAGSTILLENHDEYDKYYINTYTLNDDGINMIDSTGAGFAFSEDDTYGHMDTFEPYYIPVDISKFAVVINSEAGEGTAAEFGVDEYGHIVNM